MYKPFVYLVKNLTTGFKYIGAKYSKGTTPECLWATYFTSSKRVWKLIELYGVDDFKFKVIKTFETSYDALLYENKLNRIAFGRHDYLNIHYNFIGDMSEEEYLTAVEKQRKAASITGRFNFLTKTGFFKLTDEERLEQCSKGGYAAAKKNRIRGTAIFSQDVRDKQHKTLRERKISAFYDPSLRHDICSKGGKNGFFSKAYYERNGLAEEDRINNQRQRGKKGGAKNKGFKWYSDMSNSYKYTMKQQQELSFEEFLQQNPQYYQGRHKDANIKTMWVNDGVRNYMIPLAEFDKTKFSLGRINTKEQKGARTYNDGVRHYRYSPEQQQELSFEEFLSRNPQFNSGIIKSKKGIQK